MTDNMLTDATALRCAAVTENWKRIREQMQEAALRAGRAESEITLLAATKTVPAEVINHAIGLGVTHIGENRVQELCSKYDALDKAHCEMHLIGHLQIL